MFQWWVVIAPWQQGIRVRFGRSVKRLDPGIHLKLPLVDIVYMQPIRVRAQHIQSQTLTTVDGKAVSLSAALQYEIVDLLRLYRTLHNAHDTIEQKVQGVVAGYVFGKRLDQLQPNALEDELLRTLDIEQFGLKLHGFNLTSFAHVRSYRLINGEIGAYTGYDQRLETTLAMGEAQ